MRQGAGKNLDEARGDVLKAIEPTEHACSLPTLMQGDASLQVTSGFDTATYRVPLGVIAGIVPFKEGLIQSTRAICARFLPQRGGISPE